MNQLNRSCPTCGGILNYKSKTGYAIAIKNNSSCKSCVVKKQYEIEPDKNKGDKNGRTGKSNLSIMINKYGLETGQQKYNEWIQKSIETGFKSGEGNPSYGKIQPNTGWSYKGWYKNLFFRSSFELVFLMKFMADFNRLPLSAEGKSFRIEYETNGVPRTYCPDYFDPIENKLYEIKPKRFLFDNQSKFEAAKSFVKTNNMTFVIITEDDLDYKEGRMVRQLKRLKDDGTIILTDKSILKLDDRLQKLAENDKLTRDKKKALKTIDLINIEANKGL